MNAVSRRSILLVASLQAAVATAALSHSAAAAIAAAAIGALALGRYLAVACLAASLDPGARYGARLLASSAWAIGILSLTVALAAVAMKARIALPWAVAAALAGPLGMTAMAMGTGIRALAGERGGKP